MTCCGMMLSVVLLASSLIHFVTSVDLTLVSEASGTDVVHACVAKISLAHSLLSYDEKLLRRIAYTETRDGSDTDTYSGSNNNGGIWQLSSAKYEQTKTVLSETLLQSVSIEFGIDWSSTVWSDLRKPFYSALAARLYMEVIRTTSNVVIPFSIDSNDQASYWATRYTSSSGATSLQFETNVQQLDTSEVCKVDSLDLIFIMDASSSVGDDNFEKLKAFVYNITNRFDIGSDRVRIGAMSYSNEVNFHFHLKDHFTKSSVLSAINSITYESSRFTRTSSALDAVRTTGFTESNGARPGIQGVPRVAFLVTDGKAESKAATKTAAEAMHSAGIIGIPIGLAEARLDELEAIATRPSHITYIDMFELPAFSAIYVNMSQAICIASPDLSIKDNITDTIRAGEIKYLNFPLPVDNSGITIKLHVTVGSCTLYASSVVQTPNDALYDLRFQAITGWRDAYIDPNQLSNFGSADRIYIVVINVATITSTIRLIVEVGDTSTVAVSTEISPASSLIGFIGSKVSATCYATGRPLPTFNWYRPDGSLITSSSEDITVVEASVNATTVSKKITISSLSASHVGVYRCTGTNTLPFGNPLTSISTLNLTVRQFMAVDFVGVAISSTTIRLSWEIPVVSGVNIVIQYYRIDVEEMETGRTWNIIVNTKTTQIGSLHPYYFYHFMLTAVGNGTYPTDTIVRVRTLQAAPSLPPGDLSSNSITQTSLNLTWSPPPANGQNGVIGYYIIRMTEVQTNNPFEFTSNFTYIHLTELRSYFSYTFRVAAVTISTGPYSGEYTVQLPEDVPGTSPSNFTAVVTIISITSVRVTFTWTSPPINQINGVLLGYTFTYRTVGSQIQTIDTQTQTSITITTMEIRTHYTCTVCAYTSQGCGPTAIIYLFTIQPGTIVATTTATTIKLEWNSPFKDFRIRYYQINYQIIQSSFNIQTPRPVQIINTGSREVEYTIEFLLSSTTYRIEVIAVFIDTTYQAIGTAITARTKDRDDYSVTNYRCLSVSASRLYCTWTPAQPPLGYTILRYELAYRLVDGFDYLPGYGTELSRTNLTATVTDFNIIGLRIYAGYVVELKCIMRISGGNTIISMSSVVNFTDSALAIGTVRNPRVQVNISTLIWQPPPRIDWNGIILHYLIYYERRAIIDTGDVVRRNITYPPTANNGDPSLALEPLKYERYVFENFEAHFVYRLSITIVNTKGPGTPSNVIIVAVPESVPTGPPTDIVALSITSFSITIGWKPPDPADANGVITRYSLIITRISLQYTQTIELASNVLFYKQEGLYSYENISVSLAARTAVGWGPYSKLHFFTTLEDLPGCPVNLKGVIINGDTVILTWNHPSNARGLIIDYRVIYTGYDFSRTIIVDATTVEIFQSTSGSQSMRVEIRNLFYGYLYEFKVQGRNRAGLGDNSTVTVYISSDTIVPSAPLDLQGEFVTNSSVRLTWTTPSIINGVILDYQIIYTGYQPPQTDVVLVGPIVLVTTRTEIVITELARGYYYDFRVRARNEAGFGMNSSIVMLVPPRDPTNEGAVRPPDNDVAEWVVIILLAILCALLLCILCILCLFCCARAYRRKKKTSMYRCPSAKGSLDGTCDAGKTVTLDSAEFYGRNSRILTMEKKTIVLNSNDNDQHCSEGQEPTCICEDKDPAICFDFTDSNIHLHTHDDNVPEKDCPIEVIGTNSIRQLPSIPSDCPCDNDDRRALLVHTDSIVQERDLHVNTLDGSYPRTNELHIVTDTLQSSSPVKVTIPLGASPEPPVHVVTTIGDEPSERVLDKSVEVVLQPPTPHNISREPSPYYDSLKTRSLPRNHGTLKVSKENVAFGGPRSSNTVTYRNKSNRSTTISRSSENMTLPETVLSNASGRTFENNISDIRKPPMYSVTRIRSSENLRNKPFSAAQSPSKAATLQRHRTFSSPSSARKVTVREGYELKSLTISNIGGKLELQPAHMRGMRASPLRRSFSRDDLSTTV